MTFQASIRLGHLLVLITLLGVSACSGESIGSQTPAATTPTYGVEPASNTPPREVPRDQGPTVIVTEDVVMKSPTRLGVNIGASTYYDDQQVMANPLAHGGFAKGRQVQVLRVLKSTGDSVVANIDGFEALTMSLAGGVYTIATGTRAGETGAIVAHEPGSATYQLEKSGAPLEEEDLVWVKGPLERRAFPDRTQGEAGIGMGDFRIAVDEGVTLDYVDNPDNTDDQFMRLTFPAGVERTSGGFKHYIRATPDTEYRLRIRARGEASGAELVIGMRNYGVPHEEAATSTSMVCDGDTQLTAQWRDYVFTGHTAPDPRVGEHFGVFIVGVRVTGGQGGAVYIDEISLQDSRLDTPSGFARPLVDHLKEARAGVLRFYGNAALGSLTRNITARNATEAPWSFLSMESFYRTSTNFAVVDQWMTLCEEVGAAPWITVGSANMPQDWYELISYLAAPAGFDEHSARRAAHGFDAPWTEQFDKIYLEIGNEWWNAIFRPFYTYLPAKYGELCTTILEQVRQHPHFDPERMEIIGGGWAINAHHWNGIVDAHAPGLDRISLAPYVVHALDRVDFGALFAEVDAYRSLQGAGVLKDMQANGHGTGLAIYELNTHVTGGKLDAETTSLVTSSLGAGVAVLDQALSVMNHMGANPVNYFTALQRAFNDRLGLWGMFVRESSGVLRPRPVWHGLRLANQHLIEGDFVRVEPHHIPTWDQPENGSVPKIDQVPYIHAYATLAETEEGGRRCNVLLINRDLSMEHQVTVELPFDPRPDGRRITLTGPVTANNEKEMAVDLEERSLAGAARKTVVTLPPHAAVALRFTQQ
jgi:hypothetical protein